ncbi:Yip1 family protein [Methylophaga sp. OBS4]|uniref:Yip1 family protein n=1 Tax=Methylophaga sp. OBS4 TaxID=2991935 RepID=UPI00224CFE8B|nr:Yip1 family protein [Methylophaga sp. OBS4]MCX4187217.1 YIP1 family protein [Methylophaga sp. OBS4]
MYTHHHHHFWGLFSVPRVEWKSISEEKDDLIQFGLARLSILAAVPAISFLIGITLLGWSLSGAEYHKVAVADAVPMAITFYLLIGIFTLLMGYFTFSMERAFGTEASFGRCLVFVTYTATPMYMAGLVGFVPIVWLCMIVLMAAVAYSLYLLYVGIPIYMNIPEGKGFIVSTSIISAGLCLLVIFNVATVIIWSMVVV